MLHGAGRSWSVALLFLAGLIGCSGGGDAKKSDKDKKLSGDEREVKDQFTALQKALDDRDAEKIWALLDDKSQKDAEAAAKYISEAFAKAADDKAKADMEKKYTFVETEKKETKGQKDKLDLATLTGKTVLRTKTFHDKYHELEESKFEKVVVEGDKATVFYVEDNDKGTVSMVKQGGQWKAFLQIPR